MSVSRTLFRSARAAALRPAPSAFFVRPAQQFQNVSRQAVASRFYATEGEAAKEEQPKTVEEAEKIKAELEAKQKEVVELKDKYMRSVADFRNLQERTKREVQAAKDFALQKFAKDLVESVDNLDRALAMVPEEKLTTQEKNEHVAELVNLYEGLKMTEGILMTTLKKHGLERIDPELYEKFDPNHMEAMFMAPMVGKDDNSVMHTQRKGWKLNGRTMRAAQVGVVKNA